MSQPYIRVFLKIIFNEHIFQRNSLLGKTDIDFTHKLFIFTADSQTDVTDSSTTSQMSFIFKECRTIKIDATIKRALQFFRQSLPEC